MKRGIILLFLLIFSLQAICSEEPSFTISTSYNNLLSNRDRTGMLDRIMIEAFSRLGMEAELVYTPTEKSLVDVNAGIIDAEINRIEGMEKLYSNLIRVPESNMVMQFVAFSRENLPVNGWESIRDLHIGVVRGWKILENNTRGFPNVVFVPTEKELFNMLRKGRLDIALYSKLTGYAVLQDLGYEGIRHIEPPLANREMYLYVHLKHREMADDIAGAIRSMKEDGTYDRIVGEIMASYNITDE